MSDPTNFGEIYDRGQSAEKQAASRLANRMSYMGTIAVDGRGTPPETYLSPDDAKLARDFIRQMAQRGLPNSAAYDLTKTTSKPFFLGSPYKKLWRGRGYQIGTLSVPGFGVSFGDPGTRVILCEDENLRCNRSSVKYSGIFPENYKLNGFGVLPDRGTTEAILVPGLMDYTPDNEGTGGTFYPRQMPLRSVLVSFLS